MTEKKISSTYGGWMDLNEPEPKPVNKETYPNVWDLVLSDMKDRDTDGAKKYAMHLRPFNGRKALIDAYQEQLDLTVYLRQSIYEFEHILIALKELRELFGSDEDIEKIKEKFSEIEALVGWM